MNERKAVLTTLTQTGFGEIMRWELEVQLDYRNRRYACALELKTYIKTKIQDI